MDGELRKPKPNKKTMCLVFEYPELPLRGNASDGPVF